MTPRERAEHQQLRALLCLAIAHAKRRDRTRNPARWLRDYARIQYRRLLMWWIDRRVEGLGGKAVSP